MLEAVIAVKVPDFVADISKKHDAMIKILGCVPFSKTGARSLIEVKTSEDQLEVLMNDFKESHGFSHLDIAKTGKDRILASVSTTKCAICSTMAGSGCFLISVTTKNGLLNWTVLANSTAQISKDISSKEELTKRQEDILKIALEKGYFDYPKHTSIRELAKMFGISISTLSEILRSGQKKIMAAYFKDR